MESDCTRLRYLDSVVCLRRPHGFVCGAQACCATRIRDLRIPRIHQNLLGEIAALPAGKPPRLSLSADHADHRYPAELGEYPACGRDLRLAIGCVLQLRRGP